MRGIRGVIAVMLVFLVLVVSGCTQQEPAGQLDNRCILEPDPGVCEAYMPRYYFNQTEGICKEFIWGGCEGTVPFETLEECQTECEHETPSPPATDQAGEKKQQPKQMPLITHEANDEDPNIMKANGIYYVAWYSDRSGNHDIWMMKGDISDMSDPQAIIASTDDEFYPTLAYDGKFHLSFFRIDAVTRVSDVWYASSSDAVDWEEERITNRNAVDWVPRIFFFNGNTYIVWGSIHLGNHEIFLTSNDGSRWSEPVQITDDPLEDNFPHISVIGNKMYLAWSRFNKSGGLYGGPGSRVLLSSSEDGVSWSDPEVISDESVVATDVFPMIYSKDDENYVVWTNDLKDPFGDIVQRTFNNPTYEYLTNNPFPDYSAYVAGDYMVWVVDPDKTAISRDIYIKEI